MLRPQVVSATHPVLTGEGKGESQGQRQEGPLFPVASGSQRLSGMQWPGFVEFLTTSRAGEEKEEERIFVIVISF